MHTHMHTYTNATSVKQNCHETLFKLATCETLFRNAGPDPLKEHNFLKIWPTHPSLPGTFLVLVLEALCPLKFGKSKMYGHPASMCLFYASTSLPCLDLFLNCSLKVRPKHFISTVKLFLTLPGRSTPVKHWVSLWLSQNLSQLFSWLFLPLHKSSLGSWAGSSSKGRI